jgi:hypothetical protein
VGQLIASIFGKYASGPGHGVSSDLLLVRSINESDMHSEKHDLPKYVPDD